MNILLCSVPFRPSVGGIETVSALLAERFQAWGHEVVVLTRTPGHGSDGDSQGYRVVRAPGAAALWHWVRWADVVLHNNISLRFAWPLALLGRPWVVAHHTWLPSQGPGGFAGRLKRCALRRARNIAVSRAVAAALPVACNLLPNPYASDVFSQRAPQAAERDRDLLFVGRLVSDKGLDVLLDALAQLARQGARRELTVVGDGPEQAALRAQVHRLGLGTQVAFAGRLDAVAVAALMRRHRVLVVPSVWEEPFGIVALEALACGCLPVVARSGGLPEAIGAHGLVFDKSDSASLARTIEQALDDRLRERLLSQSDRHLAQHYPDAVARGYLDVLVRAVGTVGDVVRA